MYLAPGGKLRTEAAGYALAGNGVWGRLIEEKVRGAHNNESRTISWQQAMASSFRPVGTHLMHR